MGNSEWLHVVSYQEDVPTTLKRLQAFVFSTGRFFKGYSYADDEWPNSLEELRQRSHGRTHSVLDVDYVVAPEPEMQPEQEPLFPIADRPSKQLPAVVGQEGAVLHDENYLDIPETPQGNGVVHGFGIYPLPPALLRNIFGSERPTKYQAMEALDRGALDHYGCIYVVTFDSDGWQSADGALPTDVLFYGVTGGGP